MRLLRTKAKSLAIAGGVGENPAAVLAHVVAEVGDRLKRALGVPVFFFGNCFGGRWFRRSGAQYK